LCRTKVETLDDVVDAGTNSGAEADSQQQNSIVYESTKILKIKELIKDIISKNEKVVIVSQWVTMIKLISKSLQDEPQDIQVDEPREQPIKKPTKQIKSNVKKEKKVKKQKKVKKEKSTHTAATLGYSYVTLDGSVSLHQRNINVNTFQTDPNCKVCFLSLMACAEGINLTAANHVILVDSWYNNSKMLQVSERVNRIGQTRPVYIYNLKITDSIEEKVTKRVQSKNSLSKLILSRCLKDEKKHQDMFDKIEITQLLDNNNN
jgi:SNF2 family DNA or RNA helicase